ncbi:MAG TPA: hypothetical protein VF103_17035 [Polyangiaceae bacterium]
MRSKTIDLACVALSLCACGESSSNDGDHGDDDVPIVAMCPDVAPRGMPTEPCEENLPNEGCSYTLECATGPHDFTFTCEGGTHAWFVEPEPCEREAEFCTGGEQQVRCDQNAEAELAWGALFTGYDIPFPCPTETPMPGDACTDSLFAQLHCGYFCEDGTTWTVGYCGPERTWVFDDACDGG